MAEAPGSRTQPPRVSGERPILKTGRATGPHSLPQGRTIGAVPVVGEKGEPPPVVPAEDSRMTLAVDQANIASARALLRFLRGEIDPLALTQELENGAAHRAAVKEVFDSALIADESKPFVNQQTRDRAGWHTVPPVRGLANCPELGSSSPMHPFPDARRQLLTNASRLE